MNSEIHCSACDALIERGSQFCPGCGLSLTAQATPAVYVKEPLLSFGQFVVLVGGILLILCYVLAAVGK